MLNSELSILSDDKLDSLLFESQRDGDISATRALIVEKSRRGPVSPKLLRQLEWNRPRVKAVLQPFVDLSRTVVGSTRTKYSEAGGRRIGRKGNDPDKLWVDTYTAIKTKLLNATFACHIFRPGSEPVFVITITPDREQTYKYSELDDALRDWSKVAQSARIEL